MKTRTQRLLFCQCLPAVMLFALAACNTDQVQVSPEVAAIISEKCADCHSKKLANTPDNDRVPWEGGCTACHGPLPAGHDESGCLGCHTRPEESHFSLRDAEDQTRLSETAEPACLGCHASGLHRDGKGFPPLTQEDEIILYARQGTLRQWIQPGGAMAKYVTASEASVITEWIDGFSAERTLGYDPYLDAVKIDSEFDITGRGDDPAWDRAPAHEILLTPAFYYTQTDRVTLKALYSDDHLYIRAEYADPTLNMTLASSWTYDPEGNTWHNPPVIPVWGAQIPNSPAVRKQAEDRFGMIWNMSIPDYRTRYGCAVKCHGNTPGAAVFTDTDSAVADVWVARAAGGVGAADSSQNGSPMLSADNGTYGGLTAGSVALSGTADDRRLTGYMDLDSGYDTQTAGRRPDSGNAPFSRNAAGTGAGPLYVESTPADYIDAMTLTREEITAGETIMADPSDPAYAGPAALAAAWSAYAALGAVVPERVLEVPGGSRADVASAASWQDGQWIFEFKRRLQTGNEDDVQFDTTREVEFSLAVFDNCGWGEIPTGHTTYGNGQYQVLRFTAPDSADVSNITQ